MAKIVKKSPIPLYGAAAVWLLWAVFLPMYALWHFALVAAASVLVWFGLKKLCPDKVLNLPDPEPQPEPEPQAGAGRTGAGGSHRRRAGAGPVRAAAAGRQHRGREDLRPDRPHGGGHRQIFDIVAGQPAKLPQIRRFLNYYLPTTLKLLNAYDRMGSAGVEGANIDGTMGRIDAMMDKVVQAFDKQLDALFADEALDISTDITVLEQMLAREGLGGMQMGQS